MGFQVVSFVGHGDGSTVVYEINDVDYTNSLHYLRRRILAQVQAIFSDNLDFLVDIHERKMLSSDNSIIE